MLKRNLTPHRDTAARSASGRGSAVEVVGRETPAYETADPNVRSGLDTLAARALDGASFDAVVDWIAFHPAHVERDLDAWSFYLRGWEALQLAERGDVLPAALALVEA